jgi:hypothetical protein
MFVYPDVEGRITLRCIFRKRDGGYGLDYLAQDRDTWWGLVNAVMNLPVP